MAQGFWNVCERWSCYEPARIMRKSFICNSLQEEGAAQGFVHWVQRESHQHGDCDALIVAAEVAVRFEGGTMLEGI